MTTDKDNAATKFLTIAVEEAFSIPEIAGEFRKLVDTGLGEFNLDHMTVKETYREGGLGKFVLDRLLDFDNLRLSDMDANGVDVHLLSLTAPGVQMFDADTATELATLANDRLAEVVARHPTRYAGLASFAPQSPKRAVKEMERAIRKLGLNGFVVNSHTNGEYLDHPKYWPILEAAEALDCCIYIHPRCPPDGMSAPYRDYHPVMKTAGWGYAQETSTHAVRIMVSGILDRFPKLKLCLGHMGEGVHFWFSRLDHINQLVQKWGEFPTTKLKPSEYFKRNFVITTSGVEDHEALKFSIDRLGADNVLWAIDYPYQESGPAVRFMDTAPIPADVKEKVYGSNAARVFHIDRKSNYIARSRA